MSMAKIVLLYSTSDGHTLKICRAIQDRLQDEHSVEVVAISDAGKLDLQSFDKVVIGASIRYGHHQPEVTAFINRNQALLDRKANGFFSVNVVARKPNKSSPQTNPYLRKFLRRITWKPKLLAVFAGRLDYPAYGWLDRNLIRFIMLLTGGPTDPNTTVEFTDWRQVAEFAERIGAL